MTAEQQPGVPDRLHFFLSYARSDDDPYVERFYRDLCAEVRVRAGLASNAGVGFFDRSSIEIGATWSAELVDALANACSFVALVSPRYFASEPCGREWQIFIDRMRQHEATEDTRSAALLPVLWLPPRQVPEVVQAVQYDRDVFSEAYRRDGLRQLMRLRRNEDEYIDAISILANRIVDDATTDPLTPLPEHQRVEFVSVRSAFHPDAQTKGPTADENIPIRSRPCAPPDRRTRPAGGEHRPARGAVLRRGRARLGAVPAVAAGPAGQFRPPALVDPVRAPPTTGHDPGADQLRDRGPGLGGVGGRGDGRGGAADRPAGDSGSGPERDGGSGAYGRRRPGHRAALRDGELVEVRPFGREESVELLRQRMP